jgi:hypothetical protein
MCPPPEEGGDGGTREMCPPPEEGGDGGEIGECADGDMEPITDPYIGPDSGCYVNFAWCAGGCWFYDYDGYNPVPVDPSFCEE